MREVINAGRTPAAALFCPLCGDGDAETHCHGFFACRNCRGVFRGRNDLPTPQQEKKRYEEHNNDIFCPGYRKFVEPVTSAVMAEIRRDSVGLDFGAGTGPVISRILQENGYEIKQYDPFFHDFPELLELSYEYVVCCEVIEHFHCPAGEFPLLKRLLKPGGVVYCMTHIYTPDISFENWYYRRDPTHVFFYRPETLEWIRDHFGFSGLKIDGRLVRLSG